MAPDPNWCLFLFDKDFRSDRVKKKEVTKIANR